MRPGEGASPEAWGAWGFVDSLCRPFWVSLLGPPFAGERTGDRGDEASTRRCSGDIRGHGWTSARWLQSAWGLWVSEGLGSDNPQVTSVAQACGPGCSQGAHGQDCPVGSVPQSQPQPRLAEP